MWESIVRTPIDPAYLCAMQSFHPYGMDRKINMEKYRDYLPTAPALCTSPPPHFLFCSFLCLLAHVWKDQRVNCLANSSLPFAHRCWLRLQREK